jgi:hypothetical protein
MHRCDGNERHYVEAKYEFHHVNYCRTVGWLPTPVLRREVSTYFVDLGMSPLCESYCADQLNKMETYFPLHVLCRCRLEFAIFSNIDHEG